MDPFKRTDIRKHGFNWCLRIVYIKFSILHISTLYKTIYRGLSFKGALHVRWILDAIHRGSIRIRVSDLGGLPLVPTCTLEISSPSKRLSRRLV